MPQPHFYVRHCDGLDTTRHVRVTYGAAVLSAEKKSRQGGYVVLESADGQPLELWEGGRRQVIGPLALRSHFLQPSLS